MTGAILIALEISVSIILVERGLLKVSEIFESSFINSSFNFFRDFNIADIFFSSNSSFVFSK